MPTHEPTPSADRQPVASLVFRVDGLDAEQTSMSFYQVIGVKDDMLDPLAEHHSADDARSFYVLYDRAATWDHPGVPQYVALYLQRDHQKRTFRFEQTPLPLPSMAQSWLIHRGCPPESIACDPERGTAPADNATRALEQRLMRQGDHYALGWSYTRDAPDDCVTLAVLRALDERAPSPFRVVVEEVDIQAGTHTLREGGFETVEEALQWCDERLGGTRKPLPPVRPAPSLTRPVPVPKPATSRPSGRSC
ncbi:hypothetical protein ACFW6E_31590 [Streptomyces olivaceoviridis]|uniref:hypothetical protein n=1 Tax=Streptomyces olivaceoviridis TaxID=1921 RepID=UPI0036A6D7A4